MTEKQVRGWIAPLTAALSLVACYGTLAAIALLGALGVTITLNETVWAGAIVIFAWLTLLALWLRRLRHRRTWPSALAAIGVAAITYAMLIAYDLFLELGGFAALSIGTFLDWRAGYRQKRQTVEG